MNVKGMQEIIEVVEQVKSDLDAAGGLKHIYFVACGGTLAASFTAR